MFASTALGNTNAQHREWLVSSVKWLSSQLGPDDFSLTECSHLKVIVTDALWLLIYLYRLEVDKYLLSV